MDAMLKLVVGGQRMQAGTARLEAQSTQLMMSGRVGAPGDDPEPTTLRYKARRDERTDMRPKLPTPDRSGDEHTVLRPHVASRTTSSPALAAVAALPLPQALPPVPVVTSVPVLAAPPALPPAPVAMAAVVAPRAQAPARRGTLAWGTAGFAAVALAALAGLFVARGGFSSTGHSADATHAAAAATVPAVDEAPAAPSPAADPLVTAGAEPAFQSPATRPLPVVYRAPTRAPVTPAVAPVATTQSSPTSPATTAPATTTQPVAEATTPEPAASFTPPPTASSPEGTDAKKLNEEADKELINLLERSR